MAEQWRMTTIGSEVLLQRGFDITRATQRDGSVPVVSSGGISSYHNQAAAPGPGVILGRKGVVGSVHYIATDYWPHDTTLWVKEFRGNVPRFVYYLFKWLAPTLASLDVGSANPTLNRNHVHPTRVRWPDVRLQRRISTVLGALDDKIELNRQMNETLEAMARALFKSWFVDFDPVRAKMAGRAPFGMDAATAALFPARVSSCDLGDCPDGWPPTALGQLLDLDKGISYKGEFLDDAGSPMVNLGCFRGDGAFDATRIKGYAGEVRERHWVVEGDLVIANTDMTQNRVVLGSPGIVPRTPAGRALFSHHVFAARFRETDADAANTMRLFCFYSLLQPDFRQRAAGFATGTTVLALPRDAVLQLEVLVPPRALLERFREFAQPLRARVTHNDQESRTLAELRDLLLPKLLSGELRIRDAEKAVEAVV